MQRSLLTSLLLLLLLLGSSPSQAIRGSARVAIVPFTASGSGASKVAGQSTRSMVRSLRQRRGLIPVLIDQGRAGKLRLCLQEPRCIKVISQALRVSYLVVGHVDRQEDRFLIDVRVVSGATAEVLQHDSFKVHRGRQPPLGRVVRLVQRAQHGVRLAAAPRRQRPVFSRSEAEHAAAIVETRDSENPLAPPPAEVEASAPDPDLSPGPRLEEPSTEERWSAGSLFRRRYLHAWIVSGVGLAAIGAGVGFGMISKGSIDEARQSGTQREAWTLRDKARKNALVANILYGAGGGVLLTSALLFYLEYRQERGEARRESKFDVAVDLSAGGATLFARGTF